MSAHTSGRPVSRTAYVHDGCRCSGCRAECAAYEKRRTRQQAYGRWKPYVDASPARAHVQSLQEQGMGWKRAARAAGLSESTVWRLLYGDPARSRPPSRRVRPATADALLAVTLDLAAGQTVPADGSWRLVHGLLALGYPRAWIAHQLGAQTPGLQIGRERVSCRTADRLRQVALEHASTPGPSVRARNEAAARGWTTDLIWDVLDGPLDPDEHDVDPIAVELALTGQPVELTDDERIALIHAAAERGWTTTAIANAARMSNKRVRRHLAETAPERAA